MTCIATAAGIVAAERRPDERVAENLGEEVLGALEVTARHVELDEQPGGWPLNSSRCPTLASLSAVTCTSLSMRES